MATTLNGTTSDDQIFGLDGDDTLNDGNATAMSWEGGLLSCDALEWRSRDVIRRLSRQSSAGVTEILRRHGSRRRRPRAILLNSIEEGDPLGVRRHSDHRSDIRPCAAQGGAGNDIYGMVNRRGVALVCGGRGRGDR